MNYLSRRHFLKASGACFSATSLFSLTSKAYAKKNRLPNIVIITTDDNDADSLGCYRCNLTGVTPNIDKLATHGVRFDHAHTTSPTCQPSRLSLFTAKYPQTNGNTGHFDPLNESVETLSAILGDNGYYTAIVGKQPNYLPEKIFKWTRCRDENGQPLTADTWDESSDGYWGMWRSPEGLYKGTKYLVSEARQSSKPFFLHLNTSDPHRPWPGNIDEVIHLTRFSIKNLNKKGQPLRPYPKNYSPWEVPVPEYLPDLPGVRIDVAQYFSSLHNGDKAVGRIMDALKEENTLDNTIIIYLADQGAPFPTSKQNLYRYSTRIPLIIKWPGITKEGQCVSNTMVSIMDIMPTLLEGINIPCNARLEGKSFLDLLKGKQRPHREYVFTSYNYAWPGIQAFPMRAVQSKQYLYIFNGWPGEKNVKPPMHLVYDGVIDPLTGYCWKAMKEAAQKDEKLKQRVEFIKKRVPEEFYDLSTDPFCLNNLIDNKRFKDTVINFKNLLEQHLIEVSDPILNKFKGTGQLPPQWLIYTNS